MQPPSIRSHLVALVLAVALPLLAFSLVQSIGAARQQRQLVEEGLARTSRALSVAIETELKATVAALQALAASNDLDARSLQAFYDEARRVREQQPWYSVWVAEPDGRQILNLARPLNAELPAIGDLGYFEEVVRTRRPAISGLLRGRLVGGLHIAVAVPVVRDGKLKYILAAGFRPEALAEILVAQLGDPGEGIASIVDRSYTVLARTREAARWVGQRASEDYIAAARSKVEGLGKTSTLEGVEYYSAFRRLPRTGWTIGVGVPSAVVEAPLRKALVESALLALFLALAATGAAWLLGRRIAQPAAQLAAATKDMARGARVGLARRPPVRELAVVADALEKASEAIEERDALAQRERAALRAADEAKDEFIAMLSHELRNPLASLTMAGELLRLGAAGGQTAAEASRVVQRQTRQMGRLVEDLLDVSRITTGKVILRPELFDLAELVTRSVQASRQSGPFRGRRLSLLRADSAWIRADRARVEQILANLLDNAAKFTPAGKTVRVEVVKEPSTARLVVEDEGEGLAPELVDHLFNPFVQGKQGLARSRGGMGLGLALVKRLAELQGGSVCAASAGPGRGAAFTVRLPLAGELPRRAPAPAAPRRAHAGRCRVLVVEDNDDVRRMLRRALEIDRHEVYEAPDGTSAVALALARQPNVAFIDIGLPDLDGYEVARAVRQGLGARIFLVAVTGYGQPEDRRRALEAGFDEHVAKPVTQHTVDEMLAAASCA